jgi:hypothetical protein
MLDSWPEHSTHREQIKNTKLKNTKIKNTKARARPQVIPSAARRLAALP